VSVSSKSLLSLLVVVVVRHAADSQGITRYTSSCFPSAIDLLSRGVVDLKQLITKSFPMSQSKDAFDAVASGREIKVIVRNQDD
jgi:D-xylulose reductase